MSDWFACSLRLDVKGCICWHPSHLFLSFTSLHLGSSDMAVDELSTLGDGVFEGESCVAMRTGPPCI